MKRAGLTTGPFLLRSQNSAKSEADGKHGISSPTRRSRWWGKMCASGLARVAHRWGLRKKIRIGWIVGKRRSRLRFDRGSGRNALERDRHSHFAGVHGVVFIDRDAGHEILQHRLVGSKRRSEHHIRGLAEILRRA